MPTTHTVTSVSSSGVATHVINITGLAGIIFWSILVGLIFYIVGFFTTGWQIKEYGDTTYKRGLWDACVCGDTVKASYEDDTWFETTQAMASLGLVFLSLAVITITNYMFLNFVNKSLMLKLSIGFCFVGVVFMTLAFIIFGAEISKDKNGGGGLHYSYALCIMGAIACLAAGIVSIVQLIRANSV